MPVPLVRALTRRAYVYRFGSRWHWKCGARRGESGRCLGGPAPTQAGAFATAWTHVTIHHCALVSTTGGSES